MTSVTLVVPPTGIATWRAPRGVTMARIECWSPVGYRRFDRYHMLPGDILEITPEGTIRNASTPGWARLAGRLVAYYVALRIFCNEH